MYIFNNFLSHDKSQNIFLNTRFILQNFVKAQKKLVKLVKYIFVRQKKYLENQSNFIILLQRGFKDLYTEKIKVNDTFNHIILHIFDNFLSL